MGMRAAVHDEIEYTSPAHLLVKLGHRESLHAAAQTRSVHVGPEQYDPAGTRAVSFETLKALHAILEAARDRVDLQQVVWFDRRRVPSLVDGPVYF